VIEEQEPGLGKTRLRPKSRLAQTVALRYLCLSGVSVVKESWNATLQLDDEDPLLATGNTAKEGQLISADLNEMLTQLGRWRLSPAPQSV